MIQVIGWDYVANQFISIVKYFLATCICRWLHMVHGHPPPPHLTKTFFFWSFNKSWSQNGMLKVKQNLDALPSFKHLQGCKFLRLGNFVLFECSCEGQYAMYWNFKYTVRKVVIYDFLRYMIKVNRLRKTHIICHQRSIPPY